MQTRKSKNPVTALNNPMKELRNGEKFRNLFILDIANNHQGDVEHGIRIIREHAKIVRGKGVRAAIKFQFRNLPEFIHPTARRKSHNKNVDRFLSTQISWASFEKMVAVAREESLLTVCTPFDEASVQKVVEMKFDYLKIASCSARDWPLLEKATAAGLPIIASTGGLTESEVDDLVSFLTHRGCEFALMHCVSLYPTPEESSNLSNIAGLRKRYPGRVVGWSTHESPQETVFVGLAWALGAEIFERHIGLEQGSYKLNSYSSSPSQIDSWLAAYKRTLTILGSCSRLAPTKHEMSALQGLERGVFARSDLQEGDFLFLNQVLFAFPKDNGQLSVSQWKADVVCCRPISAGFPIMMDSIKIPEDRLDIFLKQAIHEVKALLAYAGIALNHEFVTEYSHHYGVRNFRNTGAVLISVILRSYAKKIIVQLPGQKHPQHYHKLKEETFQVLWGRLLIEVDGRKMELSPGDTLTVLPGVWHGFSSPEGSVFEEISSTAYPNDSVYQDPKINQTSEHQRKTIVDHWGRFQIQEQIYKD